MYERRHEALLPRSAYVRRVLRGIFVGFGIIFGSLGIGVLGYHFTENLPWLDALVNASMILFGEGPLASLQTTAGKWFASFYAMFSGVAFFSFIGVIAAPIVHRVIHKFHLEGDAKSDRKR